MPAVVTTIKARQVVEVFPTRRIGGVDAVALLTLLHAVFAGNSVSVFMGIEDGKTVARAIGYPDVEDTSLQQRIKALVDFAVTE